MTGNPQDRAKRAVRGGRVAGWWAMLACGTAAAVTAAAAPAAPRTAAESGPAGLQKDVDGLVAAGAPGAILVVRNGPRASHYTSGFADVRNKQLMRPDDRFKIASLTKSYTAAVVLQLVAEEKLSLKDSVEQRLPGLVPGGASITVRHLLNHTSGIFDFENDRRLFKPYYAGHLEYFWSMRQLVEHAVAHKPLFEPGAHQSYSNTNYVIAGLIVQAVTRRTIGAELRRRIFRPLQLRSTTYPTKPGLPSPYAHGYMVFGKQAGFDITRLSPSISPSSGAIVSTADDVADFYRGLLTGHLLRHDLLQAMKTPVTAGRHGYGLGLMRTTTRCGPAWGHDGAVAGYAAIALSSSDGRRQAVLMVNHDPDTLANRAKLLFDRLIAKAYCSAA
jgi:D-alanyl-D-alanine carboxypeptidase